LKQTEDKIWGLADKEIVFEVCDVGRVNLAIIKLLA
jgi:hypothetical protein